MIYRENIKRQLLAGGNPLHHDPGLIDEMEQGNPALSQAIDAWYDRYSARPLS